MLFKHIQLLVLHSENKISYFCQEIFLLHLQGMNTKFHSIYEASSNLGKTHHYANQIRLTENLGLRYHHIILVATQ